MQQADIAKAIEYEFLKDDGLKDKLVAEIHQTIDARVGRYFISGGIVLLVVILSAWFTLTNRVDNNQQAIKAALTQDQAALIIQRLDSLKESVDEKNTRIDSIDARLRAAGY